ncbi:MAG: helix-turn-helix domain-containing protein [Muribaculaceae bacterium]
MAEESRVEIVEIDSAKVRGFNERIRLEKHGFILCRRGSLRVSLDDNAYTLNQGDMYIYPAFSWTSISSVSADFEGIAGIADFDYVIQSLDSISNSESQVYLRFNPVVSLSDEQRERIESVIAYATRRTECHTPLYEHIIDSLVRVFCFEVMDAFLTNKPMPMAKQSRKDKIFQQFMTDLYRNFRSHRDVTYYAELQSLTPRYFTTLIHRTSGKTAIEWISMFVIVEAKHLLANPKMSIKEVAYRLNFSEQSFFGRYFRQYAGCSPSDYRNSLYK